MSRRPSTTAVINGGVISAATPTPRAVPSTAEDKLTLAQLCAELQIARSTFYDWRAKGNAPRCIRLPNGDLRVRRQELERWLERLEEQPS